MDKFAQTMGKAKETNEPLVGLGEAITSNIVNPLTQLAGNVKGMQKALEKFDITAAKFEKNEEKFNNKNPLSHH